MSAHGRLFRLERHWSEYPESLRAEIIDGAGMRIVEEVFAYGIESLDLPKGLLGVAFDRPVENLELFSNLMAEVQPTSIWLHGVSKRRHAWAIDPGIFQFVERLILIGSVPEKLFNLMVASPALQSLVFDSGQKGSLDSIVSEKVDYIRNPSGMPLPTRTPLTSLSALFIANSRVPYSLASLSTAPKLTNLAIHFMYGGLVHFDSIEKCRRLSVIDISGTSKIDAAEVLLRMPQIERAVVFQAKGVSDEIKSALHERWKLRMQSKSESTSN